MPPADYPWLVFVEAVASVLFAGATAYFAWRLFKLERSRETAHLEVLSHVALRRGKYRLLIVNRGGHDTSIEWVWYERQIRGSPGPFSRQRSDWVRRTAKTADEVRGLGLMIRSGERLWFTVNCFEPSALDEHTAGISLFVRGVLETEGTEDTAGHHVELRGATVSGDMPPPPTEDLAGD